MATTITYKGNMLDMVLAGETKTLATAGKYMEGDVILADAPIYHAVVSGTGDINACYARYDGTSYYTNGDDFYFNAGDTLRLYAFGNQSGEVYIDGVKVVSSGGSYNYTLPSSDITITMAGTVSTRTIRVVSEGTSIHNQDKSVTPTASQQIITADSGYTGLGTVTVAGDADLVAGNIKSGVNIFGVTGTLQERTAHTLTLHNNGHATDCYVQHNGVKYYTDGQTISFYEGDVITFYAKGSSGAGIYREGAEMASTESSTGVSYNFTAPGVDFDAEFSRTSAYYAEISFGNFSGFELGSLGLITPLSYDQFFYPQSPTFGFADLGVAGDANLVASNIKSGVSIFGVSGTLVAGPDVPIFTYNDSTGTMSCNKTFAECQAFAESPSSGDEEVLAAIASFPDDDPAITEGMNVDWARTTHNSVITYTGTYNGKPGGQISYQSDGTITYGPAQSVINLTVNRSGEFDAGSSSVYQKVTVPAGTATAPSSISGSSATVSTGTNTLTLTKSVSVTPNVSTAGYVTSGTAGNSSVSLTASVTTKAAATITPTTSNQTIASGTYLTGTQTISGDANLVAGNIKNGTTIFGVTGTYTGGGSSKNAQVAQSTSRATTSSYTETVSLTCSKTGTYDVYWSTFRSSTSGTWGSQLYIAGTAYGSAQTGSWSNHIQNIHLSNVSLTANQSVSVYVRTRGSNYYGYAGTLTIIES